MIYQNIIYLASVVVFITGLYMIMTEDNYLRKIMGLSIFQAATIIFFLAIAKSSASIVPFYDGREGLAYSAALPHVLMLTAIVVGFATLSVALALIYRIKHDFGSISEHDINQ